MASKLEFRHGRPAFVHNGERLSYAAYSDPRLRTDESHAFNHHSWRRHAEQFAANGYKFFSISPNYTVDGEWGKTRFWQGPDNYPEPDPNTSEFCFEQQMRILAEVCPDARVFVRLSDHIPESWGAAYPDECLLALPGDPDEPARERFHRRGFRKPSLASEIGRRDVCRYFRHVVGYLSRQPWYDKVVGFACYPSGEGITALGCSGFLFDHAPVMHRAFRAFLEREYNSVDALREAWGRDDIDFASALYPTDGEWRQWRAEDRHWPGSKARQTGREKQIFTDEEIAASDHRKWQAARDYMRCYRELHDLWYGACLDALHDGAPDRILGIDFAKQPMLGWQLRQAFDGRGGVHDWPLMHASSGAIDIGGMLDHPHLHFVNTPMDYTVRTAGYGCEPEGIADSLRIRGKVMFMENDFRTFAPDQEDHTLGAARDVKDLQSMLLRNCAWSLSRGAIDYLMIAGGAYFDDPVVQEQGIAWLRPLLDLAPSLPHRETEHAIAMIIDDSSPLWEDGSSGFQNQAVIWQRIQGLAHCGIPYRIYLLSDLEHENMPDYRCYLFPNLFQLDARRLALLRRKVLRDGRMAIFGPATGIVDGAGELGAEPLSELLGIPMQMDDAECQRRVIIQGNDPVAQLFPANFIYGDSYPYGPVVKPAKGAVEAAGGRVLGWATTYWHVNRPGLFILDGDDCKIAWSIAMPLPGNLLRELAREGGCHVWCQDDHVILASDTVAALHGARPGRTVLRLPRRTTAWDLISRQCVGRDLCRIEIELDAPQTCCYFLGEQLPE